MERRGIDALVGANVRARRAGLDLKQPALAERMTALGHDGWGAATVSRVESGTRSTSTAELVALGLALGATPEDLLDPTSFGDESDVLALPAPPEGEDVKVLPIPAWDFRAIVRGMYRPRLNFTDMTYELTPTDRVNVFERAVSISGGTHDVGVDRGTAEPRGDER